MRKLPDRKLKAAKGAFDASIECGITFFDTAEVYGAGVRNQLYDRSSSYLNLFFGNCLLCRYQEP
jgi:aryl-alcohol dehydrogenase-like predicted oxidoreductase